MLDRLLETGAQRKKSAGGAAVSVVVHGTIIALVVASTAVAKPGPRRLHDDPVVMRLDPPTDDQPARRGTRHEGGTASGPLVPRIPLPGTPISIDAPIVTPAAPTDILAGDPTLIAEIGRGNRASTLGGTGVAADESVDVPVRALGDRAPAYPETLRAAGITGTVRVQFVVDTTGRAEPSSIRVLESTHALFTQSVLATLRSTRFTPGEVAGHRVRTLVERSFRFDIAGGQR